MLKSKNLQYPQEQNDRLSEHARKLTYLSGKPVSVTSLIIIAVNNLLIKLDKEDLKRDE